MAAPRAGDPQLTSEAIDRAAASAEAKDTDSPLPETSSFRLLLLQLRRSWPAMISLVVLIMVVAAAAFAPWLTSRDPSQGDLRARLQPPSAEYLLGTDEQGRDMLTRVIHGARIALQVGVLATLIGLAIGVAMGLLSGYYRGWTDTIIMRITDIVLSFPYILLVIAIVSILGPSIYNAMVAIGIRIVPEFARLVRSVVLSLRTREYVLAARAVGASDTRIILRHILPNCTAPIIVLATLNLAGAILAEASLSFLGLGAQPPAPSWGSMVARGGQYLVTHPHLSIVPGLAIMIVVYALNIFGDWLRDVLDPQTT